MYYVISNTEDGEARIHVWTKAQLLECLRQEHWGRNAIFLGAVPDADMNYWSAGRIGAAVVLIIKGEIVQPHPIETVRDWDIP